MASSQNAGPEAAEGTRQQSGSRVDEIRNVADIGNCSACGVCVGTAPRPCLSMQATPDGFYRAVVSECADCRQCLDVCPWSTPPSEELAAAPLGNVLECFVGYSTVPGERERGSSGALVTRLAKALLERGMVDGAIAPVRSSSQDRLFEPAVLRTPEEIDGAAGSKYYPVEFSRVLRELRDVSGRYVLIGLPCVIAAIARARKHHRWLADRIPYLFGLVCGHEVTKQYTDVLAHLSGIRRFPLASAEYRVKAGRSRAGDFGFAARGADGEKGRVLGFLRSPVGTIWCEDLLTPEACFYCPDLFGVHADVSFMDAWLPRYERDVQGTSIVVVRTTELIEVIAEERNRERVHLSPIGEDEALRSQAAALRRRQHVLRLRRGARPKVSQPERPVVSPPGLPWGAPALAWRVRRARLCRWLLSGAGWRQACGTRAFLAYVWLLRRLAPLGWMNRKARGAVRRVIRVAIPSRRSPEKGGGPK